MSQIRPKADVLAVTLSIVCVLHCLLLPVVVITLPSVTSFFLADEEFHVWMVIAVLPISSIALFNGLKQHQNSSILALGVIGLLVLVGAAFLGHDFLNESWERLLTVLGTALLTVAHIRNFYLWKASETTLDKETRNF